MAIVSAGMTVSLDGFVSDRRGSAGRLMGRRTFELGDPDSYVGDYEFQVPVPPRLR